MVAQSVREHELPNGQKLEGAAWGQGVGLNNEDPEEPQDTTPQADSGGGLNSKL